MGITRVPHIPKPLLDELDKRYPHRCPSPTETEREIWMKAGARRLVDWLQEQHRRQEQESLFHVKEP